jgi:hypothetical protein
VNKKVAFENLKAITALLEERGIPAWLDGGSLLGCYRGGDLIDHDDDTDLGIHLADWRREPALDFLEAVRAAGFTVARYFGEVSLGLEICLERGGVPTDLFFYYPEGERVWCGAWGGTWYLRRPNQPRYCGLIKYYYERFELRSMSVQGVSFHVPADTEKFLVTLYGAGWRVPDPTWSGLASPTNRVMTTLMIERDPTVVVEAEFLARALPRGPAGPEVADLLSAKVDLSLVEALHRSRARRHRPG